MCVCVCIYIYIYIYIYMFFFVYNTLHRVHRYSDSRQKYQSMHNLMPFFNRYCVYMYAQTHIHHFEVIANSTHRSIALNNEFASHWVSIFFILCQTNKNTYAHAYVELLFFPSQISRNRICTIGTAGTFP